MIKVTHDNLLETAKSIEDLTKGYVKVKITTELFDDVEVYLITICYRLQNHREVSFSLRNLPDCISIGKVGQFNRSRLYSPSQVDEYIKTRI